MSKLEDEVHVLLQKRLPGFTVYGHEHPLWLKNYIICKYGTYKDGHPIWMGRGADGYLELDFMIEELDFAIEMQGLQHRQNAFGPKNARKFELLKANDSRKKQICEACNVALFQINTVKEADQAIDWVIANRNLPSFCDGANTKLHDPSWHFLCGDPPNWRSWKNIDPLSERLINEKVERGILSIQHEIETKGPYLDLCLEHCRDQAGNWNDWWLPRLRKYYPKLHKRFQESIEAGEEMIHGKRFKWTEVQPGDAIIVSYKQMQIRRDRYYKEPTEWIIESFYVVSIEYHYKRGRARVTITDDNGNNYDEYEFKSAKRLGRLRLGRADSTLFQGFSWKLPPPVPLNE